MKAIAIWDGFGQGWQQLFSKMIFLSGDDGRWTILLIFFLR